MEAKAAAAQNTSVSPTAPRQRSPAEIVRDPQQEKHAADLLLVPRDTLISAMSAASYQTLKQKADLYDALRREAPKDSAIYKYTGEVLPLIYAELAKRVP